MDFIRQTVCGMIPRPAENGKRNWEERELTYGALSNSIFNTFRKDETYA